MFDISLKMNFNKYTMKFKGQKTYSITSNKFTYLEIVRLDYHPELWSSPQTGWAAVWLPEE